MVLPMASSIRTMILLPLLACVLAVRAGEPDFEEFTALIEATLRDTGPGIHIGDRSELYRYSADGWELQLMAVWSETGWHLLALRLHHPQRIAEDDGEFHARYRRLLAGIDRDRVADLKLPELFEVPPPDYLPALPGELRGRRFSLGGFWYQARWINDGGVDENASWALRSFEVVAVP
ncbi:MAG: hypothetical protein EA418_05305 [Wenzhouxiangellaceae bacterium]|nr:MAG: hypothetical protein EA418_05305 [Wenzhouxiangellaceae bacterium]